MHGIPFALIVLHVLAIVGPVAAGVAAILYHCERDDNKRLRKENAELQQVPYVYATLEDRFAERAMHALLLNHGIAAGTLDMNVAEVAKGAYRVAAHMMARRNGQFASKVRTS